MYYILYNPNINRGKIVKKVNHIYKKLSKNYECYKINLMEIDKREQSFLNQCKAEDTLLLCGGDGTLDQFLNRTRGGHLNCTLLFYSCGSGNDFARGFKNKFIDISPYFQNGPKLVVNQQEQYTFVNGVGMGIDAVVCRSKSQYAFSEVKKGYFSIAYRAFRTFRTYSLDVEIDEEKRHYDNVWFFVCNEGKFIGGGMKVAPKAKREDDELDVCIVHSLSRLKIILLFPFIYIGKHTWFKKHVEVFKCKKFKATSDGCNILQRDGEVIDYAYHIEVER